MHIPRRAVSFTTNKNFGSSLEEILCLVFSRSCLKFKFKNGFHIEFVVTTLLPLHYAELFNQVRKL